MDGKGDLFREGECGGPGQTETPPAGKAVTLRDIAKHLGISHATVSLALSNHPRISSARRREVKEAAEALGYRRDPMLAALAKYRKKHQPHPVSAELALINNWPDADALYRFHEHAACLKAARIEAQRHGYRLQEYRLQSEKITGQRLQQILRARNTQGVLIPPHQSSTGLESFDWSDLSIIKIGNSVPKPRAHIVASDQFQAGALAIKSLAALGYRRIGYVSSERFEQVTGGNFMGGYLTAPQKVVRPVPLILGKHYFDSDHAHSANAFVKWLGKAKPDVIISSLHPLRDPARWRDSGVPPVATLSVVEDPERFGIDQRPDHIGRVAIRQLCGLIELRETGEPEIVQRTLVEARWRESKPAPTRK